MELKTKKIYVIKAVDGNPPMYFGDGADVTGEIRLRMKDILEEEKYWRDYNENIREVLQKLSIDNLRYRRFNWVTKGEKSGLRTFQGSKINRTLQLLLTIFDEDGNYILEDNETLLSGQNIKELIGRIRESDFTKDEIESYLQHKPELVEMYLSSNKYRKLVPEHLKIKYIINNKLDLEGVRTYLYPNPPG